MHWCRVLHQDSSGEVRRPWCPEARLAEHLEHERLNKQVEEKKRASQRQLLGVSSSKPPYREDFPPLSGVSLLTHNQSEGASDYFYSTCCKAHLSSVNTDSEILSSLNNPFLFFQILTLVPKNTRWIAKMTLYRYALQESRIG